MAEKPNIVVILADDLGYGDLSCFGRNDVNTENIDRLAREGMRFTDFHSNGAMCSPTRAALLTGRYQQRAGIDRVLGMGDPGMPGDVVTMADRLKQAGYTTALFGKWHLGDDPEYNPLNYGFDEFRGHKGGDSGYISHLNRSGKPDWWHNKELKNEEGYNTTLLTDYAVRFIEENRQDPFFLLLSHTAIHFPWMTPEDPAHRRPGVDHRPWEPGMDTEYSKLGPHREVGPIVRRMIEELDKSTGRVADALKQAGLDDNTLVFFTSDNGGYWHYGGIHKGEISSNGPYRGQKTEMYEGGHRVPGVAWWPGVIKEGTQTDQTTLTMDLMPTLMDMAGLKQPEGAPPSDGVSLLPLLKNETTELEERYLFWKMGHSCAIRKGPWKLVRNGDDQPELYNLDKDPGEHIDTADQNPRIVRQLTDVMKEWLKEMEKPASVNSN